MTEEEIELCLKEAKADIVGFRKGETIFNQGDTPRYITMLVEGNVSIGNDSVNGKRSIMGMFSNPGELHQVKFWRYRKSILQGRVQIRHHYRAECSQICLQFLPKEPFILITDYRYFHAQH